MKSKQENGKKAVGIAAAALIEEGMIVGLGTGSTALHFTEALGERVRNGLKVQGVATSVATEKLAVRWNIPLVDLNQVEEIAVTVDGADEVDPEMQMIKGGGGALLREKIVAAASEKMIVLVDRSKLVKKLGAFPLPLEIVPFGWKTTLRHLKNLALTPKLREVDGAPFITDGGNYTVDLQLPDSISDLKQFDQLLHHIPGVIETGLFIDMASTVLVGDANGEVSFLH